MLNESNPKKKSVLFLLPFYTGKAPSQRFRAEAYFPLLIKNGYRIAVCDFYGQGSWEILYGAGNAAAKALLVVKGFLKRIWQVLFVVPRYEYVFVQREASPLGPPVFEWLVAKLWRKKLIFDFDDATWIPNNSSDSKLISWLKAFWKVKYLCRWAHTVVAGNEYLAAYARQHSRNVVVIPTVIDTDNTYRQLADNGSKAPLVVGWTGSHSTLKYLDLVVPVLQRLQDKHAFTFLVIADKKPSLPLKDWRFLPWRADTEISDLQTLDVGIMPLNQDAWSEGKCGFKLIQYLGLGIPAVAAPVGVNKQIIRQGQNGFLAATPEQWQTHLHTLLTDAALRKTLGAAGRTDVVNRYSLSSQEQAFLRLFAAGTGR